MTSPPETVTNGKSYDLPVKRLGIHSVQEAQIFMRRGCHVCRSEGFSAHARVLWLGVSTETARMAPPAMIPVLQSGLGGGGHVTVVVPPAIVGKTQVVQLQRVLGQYQLSDA